jgi:hypothetical protein
MRLLSVSPSATRRAGYMAMLPDGARIRPSGRRSVQAVSTKAGTK